ncbi:uncharacterized protein [Aegilops tauschii subsp. strangulata]|uniref:uncharacterized protein isoform X2 n=1 Tax=Aegilops tauschii subsp. strangulata TaxID=200361 RepID=UPI003CC8C64B
MVRLQEYNQPSLSKTDHRDLINAWRRASYRTKKSDGFINHLDDGPIVHRRTLCDITNVQQPSYVIPGTNVGADHMLGQLIKPTRDDKHRKVDLRPLCNSNDPASSVDTSISHNESTYPPKATGASDVIADKNIKENTQVTEEERKRDRKKALRRAAYRQRKDRKLQDEHAQALILSANPTSSNYTSFSVDATTFHATTTVTSGLINDMEVQDVVLNNTQETKQKTDEELKRDRRNALRRVAYRRKKDKLIHDENIRPLSLSGKT